MLNIRVIVSASQGFQHDGLSIKSPMHLNHINFFLFHFTKKHGFEKSCLYIHNLQKKKYFNKLLDLTLRNHTICNISSMTFTSILNEIRKTTFNNAMFCICAKIPI